MFTLSGRIVPAARRPLAAGLVVSALLVVGWLSAGFGLSSGISSADAGTLLHPVASERISPSLVDRLRRMGPQEEVSAWVFLADRGQTSPETLGRALAARRDEISPHALWRRARARGPGRPLVDEADLPLYSPYLETIQETGAVVRTESRWLNAVSVRSTAGALWRVAELPFVTAVRPVGVRGPLPSPLGGRDSTDSVGGPPMRRPPSAEGAPPEGISYGESWAQNAQLQITDLHRLGWSGQGVQVAVLDTGFDLTHPVFHGLHVIGQWDFIHDDSVTANEPGQDLADQDRHGTLVLSVLAGYGSGALVGPAYGAEFLLAKTEDVGYERPAEEGFWVEGIEWAEGRGADVVSSSLGYFRWDDGTGYVYEDLDGHHAATTLAAAHAASLGLFVAVAMGNGGAESSPYIHAVAPADAESVAAVGAVDLYGDRAAFSSVGPTVDGRTKPDLMALGVGTWGAAFSGGPPREPTYTNLTAGTSMATPLVAGVAALLMEARPGWRGKGPGLLDILRLTASRAQFPDNFYGWGIVQAATTLAWSSAQEVGKGNEISLWTEPNPSRGPILVAYSLPEGVSAGTSVALDVFDVSGRWIRSLPRGSAGDLRSGGVVWEAERAPGKRMESGVYLIVARAGSLRAVTRAVLLR